MTEPLEMLLVNYAKKWREAGNPFRLATQLLFVRDGELVASIRADADDEDLLRIAPYAVAAYSPDATAIVLDDSALLASGLQDFMDGRTRRRANPRISAALADVITTQILNGHRRRVTIRLHALLGSRRHEELVQEARLNGLSQDALEPQ